MAITWNPSDKGAGISLSGGDLTVSAAASTTDGVRAGLGKTSGKWYFEFVAPTINAGSSNVCIGLANASAPLTTGNPLGTTANSAVARGSDGSCRYNNAGWGSVTWNSGDIIGVAFEPGVDIKFYRNNVLAATLSSPDIPTGELFPASGGQGGGSVNPGTVRFDSAAFTYAPPSGYSALEDTTTVISGGVTVGSKSVFAFNPFTHTMTGGVSAGSDSGIGIVSPVTMTGGVSLGGNSVVSFAVGGIYNLADDGVPTGGVVIGGEALIRDLLAEVGAGGVALGGEAPVLERLPFVPTGGVVLAGSATLAFVVVSLPTGGVVLAGTATVLSKYVLPAEGGVVLGGSATVSDYSAWFMPSGGVTLAGAALAYFVPSYLTATTENPRAYPYPGWAVNVETKAASRYMSLPANSFARFKGRSFVSNAGGIYEIGAEDDAGQPIKASIEFPTTDFATSYEKRMEAAYFGMSSSGKVRIKVKVKGKAPQYYLIQPTPANADQRGTRVPIGKGLVGRYWGFRIDNVAGGDFTLATAEFNPARGTRHGA